MVVLADLAEGIRPPDLDPITFDVLRNAFMNITDEMAVTLRRTAYSTNVKTRGDFSCSVLDRELRVIAQAGQPGHLVSIATAVPLSVREIGIETMRPGDAFLVNDPYRGSNHLNDITCFSPVFIGDRLAACAQCGEGLCVGCDDAGLGAKLRGHIAKHQSFHHRQGGDRGPCVLHDLVIVAHAELRAEV